MGDIGEIYSDDQQLSVHNQAHDNLKILESLQGVTINIPVISHVSMTSRTEPAGMLDCSPNDVEMNPQEAWLPITESRNGNAATALFHSLSSGIGTQALLLPVAFTTLGWAWGIICLSIAFAWQLYTKFLLVHLHESVHGTRYSRYLQLAVSAFGPKLGKLLAIIPVMYLSGGTCVVLIIKGAETMKIFFQIMCDNGPSCDAESLTEAEWCLAFTCTAILLAQRPNLNSIAYVSFIGATTAVGYCTLIWVLPLSRVRRKGVSNDSFLMESSVAGMFDVLNAIGIIMLAFRGHNLVLEIQGTLPSRSKNSSERSMWKAVIISSAITAMCLFPLAIAGFWAYGDKISSSGGMLNAYSQFQGPGTSKTVKGVIYMLVVIDCLCSFQIYAMPVFDNLELRYTSMKKKKCPRWVRTGFRIFFGALAFFIAVTFPFLPSLGALMGGITLPLTFAYPCFMWILIKERRVNGYGIVKWWLNIGLGCIGVVLSILLVGAAVWTLATKGLNANFFFRP